MNRYFLFCFTLTFGFASSPLAAQTVGFRLANNPAPEHALVQPIAVVMNAAPAANVQVQVTDLGAGTATPLLDYTFNPVTLTFTPVMAYPNTQYVLLNPIDDGPGDPNETVTLGLALIGGTAILGTTVATVTLEERGDFLMLNEVSQGTAGNQEYVEYVVRGEPGSAADLRGWIIDDNNGDFSGGPNAGQAISAGYIGFRDECEWEHTPVGSLIVVYNVKDPNPLLAGQSDPTDRNEDGVYVFPVVGPNAVAGPMGCNPMAPNLYLGASDDGPYPVNPPPQPVGSAAYPPIDQDPCWGLIVLGNGNDAAQVRTPGAAYWQGLSYGTTANFTAANHPDFGLYGADALYFTESGAGRIYRQTNAVGRDERHKQNWATLAAGGNQTPGAGNTAANTAWIDALRAPFEAPQTNTSYTCNLRNEEARRYFSPADEIHTFLRNDGATDFGPTQVNLTFGNGFLTNNLLPDAPTFLDPEWEIIPANPGDPASNNVRLRLYLHEQQLSNFVTAVNTANGTAISNTDMASFVRFYRADAASPRLGSMAQVSIVPGQIWTTYGLHYYFEVTINQWGRYALGVPQPPLLGQPETGFELQAPGQTPDACWLFRESEQQRLAIRSALGGPAILRWYAPEGKLVCEERIRLSPGLYTGSIPLHGRPAGRYFVVIQTESATHTLRAIWNP